MGSALVVSALVGVAIAVQVAVIGSVSSKIHPLAVSLSLQLAGVMVGALWAVETRSVPAVAGLALRWWWLPLGAFGWGIVAALGFSSARVGTSITLGAVVSAQLVAALALDFGSNRLDIGLRHLLGITLLAAGVVLTTARR